MEVHEIIESIPLSRTLIPAGKITSVRGQSLVATGVRMAIGEVGKIRLSPTKRVDVECVGFLEDHRVLLTPYHDVTGIRPGLQVLASR
ncbi:MAG TPA: EscN/YscN/HrcN family type III secretion system ATPase, partial [Sulfobacillus sp.]|nr:EscN/YscN/HrcN family type III secretion system ATPase [Sulfobacillus sp.]